MSIKLSTALVMAACLAAPLSAQAMTYQFNAALSGAAEVPPNGSPGTGIATLSYNDMGTAGFGDDLLSFSLFASGMSGPISIAHIHSAPVGVSGPPILTLMVNPSFTTVTTPTFTMIGGAGVASPSGTFLGTLMAGLGYVNLHTAAFSGGEIRGQLKLVAVVPEPGTYAMLLAGLAGLGFVARRRAPRA